ncbi:MAG: hypothetical protein AB1775_14130 [Bacteroidota bacterium]
MLTPKLCLIAEGVIRDAVSNNISIYNILEGITAQGFPFFFQHLDFLVLWEKEEVDPVIYEGSLLVKNNDDILISDKFKIDFEKKQKNRSIVNINGLLVKKPGTLTASLIFDGVEAKYSILVTALDSAINIHKNVNTA